MPYHREFNAEQKRLFSIFEKLNILGEVYYHPRLYTVDQSQEWADKIKGGQCKNLFLKDKKGNFALIVAMHDTQIKLNHLHKRLSMARLSFGSPEKLLEILKVTPGSVSPYALMHTKPNQINIFLDKRMFEHDLLNFHPLENWSTMSITPNNLVTFIESLGLPYQIQALDVEEAAL